MYTLLTAAIALWLQPNALAEQLSRLDGHDVAVTVDGRYQIEDIAGEGAPVVGDVQRRGDQLWLVTSKTAYRLTGTLARPRVAGPGYRIWVVGRVFGTVLQIRRIGILCPPHRCGASGRRGPQAPNRTLESAQ